MDYQFWMGAAALVVGGIGSYYQYKSVRIMQTGAGANQAASNAGKWWRTPTVMAMSVLAVLCWIPYFIRPAPEIPNDGMECRAVFDWGANRDRREYLELTANGDYLSQYPASYWLIAVAFVYDAAVDMLDAAPLAKSAPHEITKGHIPILIRKDSNLERVNGATFALLLVPRTVTPNNFDSIRQARSLGAKFLWKGSGGFGK
jgi:hypothetical protein